MLNRRFFGFFCLLFVSLANAWASDYWSPRTAALGGAGHAAPLLNDAIYLNPSFTSFLPTYSLGLGYLFYSTNDASNPGGRSYAVSIQDGRTPMLQAGVGFSIREGTAMFHFGASRTILDIFGLGLGAKWVLESPLHPSFQDVTASVSLVASSVVQASLVADNLIESNEAKTENFYREFVLGLKLNLSGVVVLYADPHYTPSLESKFGHELGLEFPFSSEFFFRAGYFKNSAVPYLHSDRSEGVGLGIGWIGPRTSFDYSFTRVISGSYGMNSAHQLGLTMYL